MLSNLSHLLIDLFRLRVTTGEEGSRRRIAAATVLSSESPKDVSPRESSFRASVAGVSPREGDAQDLDPNQPFWWRKKGWTSPKQKQDQAAWNKKTFCYFLIPPPPPPFANHAHCCCCSFHTCVRTCNSPTASTTPKLTPALRCNAPVHGSRHARAPRSWNRAAHGTAAGGNGHAMSRTERKPQQSRASWIVRMARASLARKRCCQRVDSVHSRTALGTRSWK